MSELLEKYAEFLCELEFCGVIECGIVFEFWLKMGDEVVVIFGLDELCEFFGVVECLFLAECFAAESFAECFAGRLEGECVGFFCRDVFVKVQECGGGICRVNDGSLRRGCDAQSDMCIVFGTDVKGDRIVFKKKEIDG